MLTKVITYKKNWAIATRFDLAQGLVRRLTTGKTKRQTNYSSLTTLRSRMFTADNPNCELQQRIKFFTEDAMIFRRNVWNVVLKYSGFNFLLNLINEYALITFKKLTSPAIISFPQLHPMYDVEVAAQDALSKGCMGEMKRFKNPPRSAIDVVLYLVKFFESAQLRGRMEDFSLREISKLNCFDYCRSKGLNSDIFLVLVFF